MDISKLEGLIQALESEQLNPGPSHSNLTRLVALALKEVQSVLEGPKIEEQTITTENASTSRAEVEIEEPEPEHKKKKKRKHITD